MSEAQPGAGAEARAKIKEKLRKLLAMTTENGATEAEALAAAKMAADLMAEHDLTYETVDEVKAERYGARKRPQNYDSDRVNAHEITFVSPSIGRLFHCRSWIESANKMRVYFGTEADTAAAHDMCAMLMVAMDTEFHRYMHSRDRQDRHINGRTVRTSFMRGMAGRLVDRIDEMARQRDASNRKATEGTSRALVLVTKQQQVAAKFGEYSARNNLRLHSRSSSATMQSAGAFAAGKAAGSRVNLGGAGIGGGTKMIGR